MKADKTKVCNLIKTARGQLDGIINMIEQDKYCMDISHQLLACEAVIKKANREVLRAHMESCVKQAVSAENSGESEKKIDELIKLIDKMN